MYSPIKMPRGTKYGNNYWRSNSHKIKRTVELFSDPEHDNYLFLECNPDVVEFCEQPLKIEYEYEGKKRASVLDMWVKFRDGSEEFREIKYKSMLQNAHKNYEDMMRQIQLQKKWCEERGFVHRIITDDDLRNNQILLDNYRLIAAYARTFNTINQDSINAIKVKLSENKLMTIRDLQNYFNLLEPLDIQTAAAYLIYHGIVIANIDSLHFGNRLELIYK